MRDQPIRYVVVRDSRRRRKDVAFFCTDRSVGAALRLETDAKRSTLAVTFFEMKQFLGFEDPQNQTEPAARHTAPFASLVHALVALRAAARVRAGVALPWPVRPWYRHKYALSFADLLAALRQTAGSPLAQAPPVPAPPCPSRRRRNSRPARVMRRNARHQNGETRVYGRSSGGRLQALAVRLVRTLK